MDSGMSYSVRMIVIILLGLILFLLLGAIFREKMSELLIIK